MSTFRLPFAEPTEAAGFKWRRLAEQELEYADTDRSHSWSPVRGTLNRLPGGVWCSPPKPVEHEAHALRTSTELAIGLYLHQHQANRCTTVRHTVFYRLPHCRSMLRLKAKHMELVMPINFNKDPDQQIKEWEIRQLRQGKLPPRMRDGTSEDRKLTPAEIKEEIDKIVRS